MAQEFTTKSVLKLFWYLELWIFCDLKSTCDTFENICKEWIYFRKANIQIFRSEYVDTFIISLENKKFIKLQGVEYILSSNLNFISSSELKKIVIINNNNLTKWISMRKDNRIAFFKQYRNFFIFDTIAVGKIRSTTNTTRLDKTLSTPQITTRREMLIQRKDCSKYLLKM